MKVAELSTKNLYEFFGTLAAILTFSIGIGWLPVDFSKHLRFIAELFDRDSREKMSKSKQIASQIYEIKTNMCALSPTSDFAKYFKLERTLRKLEDERAKIEKLNETRSIIGTIKLNTIPKFLLLFVAFILAWYSNGGGFICSKLNPKWLFPLNLLFPMPFFDKIFGSFSSTQNLEQPAGSFITFFDFILLTILMLKIYQFRQRSSHQIKIE